MTVPSLPSLLVVSLLVVACTDDAAREDQTRIEAELLDVQRKIEALKQNLAEASPETKHEIEKQLEVATAEEKELNASLQETLESLEEETTREAEALESTPSEDQEGEDR